MVRSSLILESRRRFCSSNPKMAAVIISLVSLVDMVPYTTFKDNSYSS